MERAPPSHCTGVPLGLVVALKHAKLGTHSTGHPPCNTQHPYFCKGGILAGSHALKRRSTAPRVEMMTFAYVKKKPT